jgi:uncharacterized protein (DUF983 family)
MPRTDKQYREARARCPRCHTGEYAKWRWVGMFPGEQCPECGERLEKVVDNSPGKA